LLRWKGEVKKKSHKQGGWSNGHAETQRKLPEGGRGFRRQGYDVGQLALQSFKREKTRSGTAVSEDKKGKRQKRGKAGTFDSARRIITFTKGRYKILTL